MCKIGPPPPKKKRGFLSNQPILPYRNQPPSFGKKHSPLENLESTFFGVPKNSGLKDNFPINENIHNVSVVFVVDFAKRLGHGA